MEKCASRGKSVSAKDFTDNIGTLGYDWAGLSTKSAGPVANSWSHLMRSQISGKLKG